MSTNDEHACPICGGVKRVEFVMGFERGVPVELSVMPDANAKLCMGHIPPASADQFRRLLELGLTAEGVHHKQWALWEIGKMFSVDLSDLDDVDKGIAP